MQFKLANTGHRWPWNFSFRKKEFVRYLGKIIEQNSECCKYDLGVFFGRTVLFYLGVYLIGSLLRGQICLWTVDSM